MPGLRMLEVIPPFPNASSWQLYLYLSALETNLGFSTLAPPSASHNCVRKQDGKFDCRLTLKVDVSCSRSYYSSLSQDGKFDYRLTL
jgi:hypothetical protein